ncbi:hypothetical protein [Bacillus massilinigeriensis]|uniref:hypothetical protein n=1 Tax=Bacillus massilionigeriensis TaxID=1805475 RepID=UPI00096B2BBA|nr:hypothetical protein [Bacillus massilionigeriensis]
MIDYTFLLNEYRLLWNNRRLMEEGTDESVLKNVILKELKDENSHPRVRKSSAEKYFLAVKRILNSTLSLNTKLLLIQLHTELMDEI